ncbi:MAG: asparagine synthase (glutamine-hydrolyzing) [Planctomycetota bacterium]
MTGFWTVGGKAASDLEDQARRMAATLRNRGPDDSGTWAEPAAGFALGHQRLSILDLSKEGHQPMISHDERFVMAYNGEVYNFPELRRDLEARGHRFHGNSDTEVVLNALAEWGAEAALKRFVGMFALALWDKQDKALLLARDRLGIKPLYWGTSGNALLFGSELKSLRAWPGFSSPLDRDSLALYFRHGFIPAPYSIFRDVQKLEPGTFVRFSSPHKKPVVTTWWSAREAALRGMTNPLRISDGEALEALEGLLGEAVAMRMVADVPLGAFLSGGIDSSTVVALMQAHGSRPVKTFSIGFSEEGFDEAREASKVARHLGTDHTELYLRPAETLALLPSIPEYWDEPFADSSQLPTFMVSRLARREVTVSLSGDGGDELFGGYNRYRRTPAIWKWTRLRVPSQRAPGTGCCAPFPRCSPRDFAMAAEETGSTNWPGFFRMRVPARSTFPSCPAGSGRRISFPEVRSLLLP